jgi:hypothetical protein
MGQGAGTQNEVLQVVAGLADLVAGRVRDVTRRLPDLTEIREELRVRGELALKRTAPVPEAHTEVLSRQVIRRLAGE